MDYYLYLQCLCYDRPRYMHEVYSNTKTVAEVDDYIQSSVRFGSFESLYFGRKSFYDTICLQLESLNISVFTIDHPLYPVRLHQLHDPPLALFCMGDIQLGSIQGLGMVGSRRASVLAEHRVNQLVALVTDSVIISGGALGIDGFAHRAALNHGCPTVAVLASGLDVLYPKSHQTLFEQVVDSGIGLIVSECPPGVVPKPYFFPQRNRLIAALSSKLLVVEAAQKSGAVITANIAAQLGVDVGAIVGAFNSPHSAGCYDLIQDGAFIIGNMAQLNQFLGIESNEQLNLLKQPHVGSDMSILDQVPYEPIHIEDLANACHLSMSEMIEKITILALNEDIMMIPGQMVRRYD